MDMEVQDTNEEELDFEEKCLRAMDGVERGLDRERLGDRNTVAQRDDRVNSISHTDLMLSSGLSQGVSWSPTSSCSL